MNDQQTKEKNEILRKIEFYKAKKLRLPNFIRTKKEEILKRRMRPADDESGQNIFTSKPHRHHQSHHESTKGTALDSETNA